MEVSCAQASFRERARAGPQKVSPTLGMRHARASAAHGGAPSAPPSGVAGRARRPVFGPRRSGGSAAGTAGGAAALAQRLSAAVQAAAVSLRRTLSPRSLAKALVQWPPRALCVLVALGWLLIWLASFHPGDETLRALSDGPLALMLSPAGVTFGTRLHVPFALKLKPGAAPPPVFDGSLNLTAEAVRLGQRAQPGCFAALLDESPTLVRACVRWRGRTYVCVCIRSHADTLGRRRVCVCARACLSHLSLLSTHSSWRTQAPCTCCPWTRVPPPGRRSRTWRACISRWWGR